MVLLTSCSRSPRVSYYTLNPAAPEVENSRPLISVQIASINIPQMLDRPHLVVRTSANRVEVLEFHRWAENLKSEIPRTVAENMTRTLKPARVSPYPEPLDNDSALRIALDFRRFEISANDGVAIELYWTIRDNSGALLKSGQTSVTDKINSEDYYTLVAALSRALAKVSLELSDAVKTVSIGS